MERLGNLSVQSIPNQVIPTIRLSKQKKDIQDVFPSLTMDHQP